MAITGFSHGARGLAGWTFNDPAVNDWQDLSAAAVVGANHSIEMYLDGNNLKPESGVDELTVQNSTTSMNPSVKTTETTEGSFSTTHPFYMATTAGVAQWWGGSAAPAQQGGTAAYLHAFSFDEDYQGQILSHCQSDGKRLREIPHMKIEKMKFTYERGKVGKIEWGVVCDRMIEDDTGANTLAVFDGAVTVLTQPTTAYVHIGSTQFVVRINAFTGGALGAGDVRYPSKIELNYERNVKRFSRTDTGLYISEPVGGDWRLVGGQLDFAVDNSTSDTDWGWLLNNTGLKMDIVATGDTIAGAFDYEWTWLYPYIEASSDGLPEVDTADVLPIEIPFVARRAPSVPAGFAVRDVTMTVQDVRTTNWLAA